MLEAQIEVQQTAKTTLTTREVIAYLAEKFPLCFFLEGEVKPLKIGLFQDLSEALIGDEKVSKTAIRQALRAYTMNWRYLHACKAGAPRVGLQGEEVGIVDETQAAHAAQSLAEAKAIYAERKAAEMKEKRKNERKAFFKQQAHQQQKKKRASITGQMAPKASLESLAALENKFGKGKK